MVFNATFNNISVILWRSVLLVGETGGHGENHRPVVSQWQTLSHNVVHLAVKYMYLVKTVMFLNTLFLLLTTWYTVSHGHMPQVNGNSDPCPPVSPTNKTDRYDITEILLKVALYIIKQINKQFVEMWNSKDLFRKYPLIPKYTQFLFFLFFAVWFTIELLDFMRLVITYLSFSSFVYNTSLTL
jgi:hypothetical protein